MPDAFVQLPPNSTGSKLHTRQRVVGSDTVQEQYVITQSARVETGVYLNQTGAWTVLASAHGATAGFFWLINPVGSSVSIALSRVDYMTQLGSALVAVTSPLITLERVTFTGTLSGATVTSAKRQTSDATPAGIVATASTGLTLTAGAAFFAFLPVASATAVGYTNPGVALWAPEESQQIVLAAGEGVVCRQANAGTTSDTRRFLINLNWQEFTIP